MKANSTQSTSLNALVRYSMSLAYELIANDAKCPFHCSSLLLQMSRHNSVPHPTLNSYTITEYGRVHYFRFIMANLITLSGLQNQILPNFVH